MQRVFLQAACLLATALLLCGCSGKQGDASASALAPPEKNELTVLLPADTAGAWPTGLDPARSKTAGANLSVMNAIFGGLFQLTANDDGTNPHIVGVLAEGYEIQDEGRALAIKLRPNIRFSDNTLLDATTLRANIERNFAAGCTCERWPWDLKTRVTIADDHVVVLHFRQPYPAAIHHFPVSSLNWPASTQALAAMGADDFNLKPIGAGPFKIVSNETSTKLVLERNPRYFESGRPYLDRLVFVSIGSEQAAYLSLLAGDAQVAEGITSPALIDEAMKNGKLSVTPQTGTSPYVIQLNTSAPPFNDKRAREALYYATDSEAIRKGIFHEWYPVSQGFTAPGGLFYHDKVEGYRTYDLDKARALVKKIGTFKTRLTTIKSAVAIQVVTALQTQWKNAGIDVEIETVELAALINQYRSGQWMATLQTAGSYDPESGSSVSMRFSSKAQLSGVHDPALDKLIEAAAATDDEEKRSVLYQQVARYISDQAYGPFILAFAPAQFSVKGVEGPGLSTKIPPVLINTGIFWQQVRRTAH